MNPAIWVVQSSRFDSVITTSLQSNPYSARASKATHYLQEKYHSVPSSPIFEQAKHHPILPRISNSNQVKIPNTNSHHVSHASNQPTSRTSARHPSQPRVTQEKPPGMPGIQWRLFPLNLTANGFSFPLFPDFWFQRFALLPMRKQVLGIEARCKDSDEVLVWLNATRSGNQNNY